ncbi:UDP-N-acetylglucosamine 2-epimerase, partial [Pseudomonadota bacterium]|nr:UDP-N-acetylglucosamine 2-epimerase [Pseudomonadota bacterium]
TVNIGSRQQGRLMSNSVINCKPECKMILKSIKKLYSKPFQKSLEDAYNPYGNGGAAKKIIKILNSLECAPQSKKKFYDMKINYDK